MLSKVLKSFSFDKQILEKISAFKDVLLSYNKKINLISKSAEETLELNHFLDSLYLLEFVKFYEKSMIADLGSGGGLPGILLAITCQNSTFFLIESVRKKCDFLQYAKNELSLKNLNILNDRIENVSKLYRGKFDFVTCRALAEVPVLLEYSAPLLKVNGSLLAYKGKNWQNELEKSKNALEILKVNFEEKYEYDLKEEFGKRYILRFEKIGSTPSKFPRIVGMAVGKPL